MFLLMRIQRTFESQLGIWDHPVDNLAVRLEWIWMNKNSKSAKALEYRTGPAWAFQRARG